MLIEADLSSQGLTQLHLSHPLFQCGNLQIVSLSGNHLNDLPTPFELLTSITVLRLEYNNFEEFPSSIVKLTNLQILYFAHNKLKNLPTSIDQLVNLQHIRVNGNQLSELPSCIGNLFNLRSMNVEANFLKELPISMGKLTNLKEFIYKNNPLTFPPESIVSRGAEAILQYLKDYENGVEEWKKIKIISIGDENVGKVMPGSKLKIDNYYCCFGGSSELLEQSRKNKTNVHHWN